MSTSGIVRRGLPGAGLISARSVVLMRALPPCRLAHGRALSRQLGVPKLLDDRDRLVGGELAVSPVVDHHHGSHTAGAHAVHLFEREEHVFGVLPRVNAQIPLDLLGDQRSAGHVAGRAVAAPDRVLGMGLQAELGVEGGDAEGHAERLAGRLGHAGHHVFGQPAEDRLRSLQKGDQRPPFSSVMIQQFAELFFQRLLAHITTCWSDGRPAMLHAAYPHPPIIVARRGNRIQGFAPRCPPQERGSPASRHLASARLSPA